MGNRPSARAYKQETENIKQFLARTAPFTESAPRHTQQRRSGRSYANLPVREYLELAKSIVKARPEIKISHEVLFEIEGVIFEREEVSRRFERRGGGVLTNENETHIFFNQILRRIYEVLEEEVDAREQLLLLYTGT